MIFFPGLLRGYSFSSLFFCSVLFFLVKFLFEFLKSNKDQGMIRKIFAGVLYCFSMSSFACPIAVPTSDVNFCASFKSAATCYCTSSGLPSGMCQDINALYNRMVVVFGSLQKACDYQHHTSSQICMDNWNCYLHGGVDSRGNICSSTRLACQ